MSRVAPPLTRAPTALTVSAVLTALTVLMVLTPGVADARSGPERVIRDPRISESSGLTPSLLHRDVLWTHNDSGHAAQIYAIVGNGSTAATITVAGEPAQDWEAIAGLRGPRQGPAPGEALMAVGDIGDNRAERESVRIVIVREPRTLADATLSPVRVLNLTYPDGPRDAEALLADPGSGRLYVVSKTLFGSELYAVPQRVWPGRRAGGGSRTAELTRVARTGASMVTDGAFRPDGTMVLRGYGSLWVVAAPRTAEDGRLQTLASASLPGQEQGESLAVVGTGSQVLIGSEGENSPVLRVRLPRVESDDGSDGDGDGDGGKNSTDTGSSGAAADSPDRAVGPLPEPTADDLRLPFLVGAGAAVLGGIVMAIVLRPNRSHRRRRRRG